MGPDDGSFDEWMREHDQTSYEAPKEPQWIDYYVSLDLGLKRDHSALSVIDLREHNSGVKEYYVRSLRRFPLNTPYETVAKALRKVNTTLHSFSEGQGKRANLLYAIDATGVGLGVSEIIARELPEVDVWKVYLTGGINPNYNDETREVHLPKRQMVSTLVALFDSGHIHISKASKELDAVIDELQSFEIKTKDNGHDVYSATTFHHDDLICSLGIGAFLASQWGSRALRVW